MLNGNKDRLGSWFGGRFGVWDRYVCVVEKVLTSTLPRHSVDREEFSIPGLQKHELLVQGCLYPNNKHDNPNSTTHPDWEQGDSFLTRRDQPRRARYE